MGCRVSVAMEFTSVEASAAVCTLISRETGSLEGTAVVCAGCSGALAGVARLDRRHAPASQWRQFGVLMSALTPGVEVPAVLGDWLHAGRSLTVACTAVHPIVAAPFALTATLDDLFSNATANSEGPLPNG